MVMLYTKESESGFKFLYIELQAFYIDCLTIHFFYLRIESFVYGFALYKS